MYADRHGPRPLNRGSLTMSVGIVGGLIAVAMLSPTVIEHVRDDPVLRTYVVPPPAPPPPPDPRPRPPVQAQRQASRIDPPDVLVPTTPVAPFVVPPDPGPPVEITAVEGTGSGIVIDPPRLPPVLTAARPDTRVDFQPTYPTEERRAGNEGVVTVRVLIGVDGRVRQVERVAAASEAFWRVTQERALGKWRFRPATRDGVPYETWRTMTVRFRLETD